MTAATERPPSPHGPRRVRSQRRLTVRPRSTPAPHRLPVLHRVLAAPFGPVLRRMRGLRPRGGRSRRKLFAAVLVTALIGGLSLLLADGAQALPVISDCKTPPTPEVPGRGVVGFFESPPENPPAPADPFAPGATTTIHDQYGYAGLRFNTYDLGCGGDLARSPDATVGNTMANWVMTFPKTMVAATGALLNTAYNPSFLGVFDPLVSGVADALRRTVFDQWAVLVIAAIGALIIWRSRRASLASTASAIGWAMLVMVIATVLFRWPVQAGQAADTTVTSSLSAVTSGLNGHRADGQTPAGAEASGNLHEALLYKAWLGGTFGDSDTAVARTYGPLIFDAQALTWSEARTLSEDPAQGQRIIEAKNRQFEEAAEAVKAQDPDAYEYLVGRRSDTRVGYAALSAVASLCAVPFLIISALLVIGALVIFRFGVMLFPAFATLGMFPTMRQLIIGIGNTLAAAVINAVIFGIGSAVMVRAMGVILDPATGLPTWLNIVLILLLTIVMWVALSPFRRLTRMVAPGYDPIREAGTGLGRMGRGLARFGGRAAATAASGFVAGRAAGAVVAGAGGGEGTADDGLRAALSNGVHASRAEATAPSWGVAAAATRPSPAGDAPPVPRDPGPPVGRDSRAIGMAPAPAEATPVDVPEPARAGGRNEERIPAGRAGGPSPAAPADQLPTWAVGADPVPAPVEPEDHEGEQVYVLYRPTSSGGGAASVTDLRDADTRTGR